MFAKKIEKLSLTVMTIRYEIRPNVHLTPVARAAVIAAIQVDFPAPGTPLTANTLY